MDEERMCTSCGFLNYVAAKLFNRVDYDGFTVGV